MSNDEGGNRSKIRDNPAALADLLSAAFKDNSLQEVLIALKLVMQAQNVKALAEYTGMRREGLYTSFNGKRDPQLSRVLRLLDALNVRVLIVPRAPKVKPPRPKPGRPRSK